MNPILSLLLFTVFMLSNLAVSALGFRMKGFINSDLSMLKLFVVTLFSLVATITCFFLGSHVGIIGVPITYFLAGMLIGAYTQQPT